ncbi:hypothetical protein EXU48_17295 [Occultella glacieicola]|uniref:ABC transporter permease n=1 Tax=Occultella glacieicola TaxID=2518684 RepID=A0ABY2E0C7_9MICO|nr:hypothetical protein [Occultella glacieicola]TDE90859.1 hypothetical protein EXU48_17295 [Occultella glacieicola]
MINQLQADLYVQRHSTAMTVSVLVACAAAALYTFLQYRLASGGLDPASASGVQGVSDILIISLLGPLLIGLAIARPFETKSVHAALLAAGRGPVVASKAMTASLAVILVSLPYGLAALVGRATGASFEPALPTTFALLTADSVELDAGGVVHLVAVSVVTGLLYAAKLAVCIPLAFVLKRPIVVMATGFVWSFVADLLVSTVSDTAPGEAIAGLTPFSADRMPLPDSSTGDLLTTTAVSVVFIAAMGALAWLLFRRADVK